MAISNGLEWSGLTAIPDYEIGVGANPNRSLGGQPKSLRRATGQEPDGPGEVYRALGGRREKDGSQMLAPRNATPVGEAIGGLLHFRRGRGMIGGNQIDFTALYRLPKCLLTGPISQGWRALGQGTDALGVLGGEEKVVRTGFAGYVNSSSAGRSHQRDACPGGDMNYMQGTPCCLGQGDRSLDRLQLGHDRAAGEVIPHCGAPCRDGAASTSCRDRIVLGMHGHGQAEARDGLHSLKQRVIVGSVKIVRTSGRHERLEPNGPGFGQVFEMVEAIGRQSTPQGEIRT